MKRIAAILLIAVMLFSLGIGCAKKDSPGTKTDTPADTGKPAATPASTGSGSAAPTTSAEIAGGTSYNDLVSLENLWSMDVKPSDTAKLKFCFDKSITSLQYIGGNDNGDLYPDTLFYETPLAWDHINAKAVPWMVSEWKWMDELTLRCKVNEGITSMMGDPYTAHDFYYTIDWQVNNPAIGTFFNIVDLANTKVIDDYTIDIAVKSPYPFLEIEMTSAAWSQVVEASVEKIGGKEATKDDERSGTGPYHVKDWEVGQYLYCERRDDYWKTPPYYKYIDVFCVNDANTRSFGIEAGDYDMSTQQSAIQVEEAANSDTMNALYGRSPALCYNFVFNTDHTPLNIVEVRQAMAMAVDYETLVKIVLRGFGDVSDAPLCSPAHSLYTPVSDESKNFIKYDLEGAKKKLVEAGYPDGFTVNCLYRGGSSIGDTTGEMLYNMLAKINVTLELQPYEGGSYTSLVREGEFDTLFCVGANPSPKRFLQPIDPSCEYADVSGYCGKSWFQGLEMQELIDRCAYTIDETERLAAWKELNDVCRELVPKFVLFGRWATVVTSNEVDGMVYDAYGKPYLWSVYANEYVGK